MSPPRVFLSYCHVDEALRNQVEKQLAALRRQGVIEVWHDRKIVPGEDFADKIDGHIDQDEIILLLVSADFIASDYCYEIEVRRAMERHATGDAVVIPVILRACDWTSLPFGKLQAVPRDGKPISQWADPDEALLQVAQGVREAAKRWQPTPATTTAERPGASMPGQTSKPRSSNLALPKHFTQRDKDRFKDDTFEYIARFVENSLVEVAERNSGYEGVFKRVDGTRFFATIYHGGKDVARGTYFTGGGMFGDGIHFVQGQSLASNSFNESLTVDADDQALFLKSMGMASFGSAQDRKLSQEGAAELMWEMLIAPLQRLSR